MTAPADELLHIASGKIEAFVDDQLEHPERATPLVVISPKRGSREPLVSPEAVVERLGARARVVALTDGQAGWELSKRVGGPLSCYWGAVRIYWPGFDHERSKSYEHPLWLSRRIEERGPEAVIDEVAKLIEGQASPPEPEPKPEPEPAPTPVVPDAVERRIDELQAALTAQQEQRAAAEQARDSALAESQAARGDLATARKRLEVERSAREAAEQARDRVRDEMEAAEGDLATAREQLEAEQSAREQVVRERDEAIERARQAEQQAETLRERQREPQTPRPSAAPFSVRTDVAASAPADGLSALQEDVTAKLNANLTKARTERDTARSDLRAAKREAAAERKDLQGQIETASEKRVKAERELAEARQRIEELQSEAAAAILEATTTDGDSAPPTEDVGWLEEHARTLEEQLSQAQDALRQAEKERSDLQWRYDLLASAKNGAVAEGAPEHVEVGSVAEAVERAQAFAHLRFLRSAIDSKGADLYERPQEVYEAFVALDELAALRANGGIGERIEDWLVQRGVTYSPKESQTTRQDRRFFDNEREAYIMCEEHLKFGTKTDPRYCLRVYMAWGDDEGKWLIAHVGEHLENTRTS